MEATKFWSKTSQGLKIDEGMLVEFLSEFGIRTYYPTDDMTTEPQIVFAKGKIIEPISPIWVHSTVIASINSGIIDENILSDNDKKSLIHELIRSKLLTKKEVLVLVSSLDKPILTDNKESAFFVFNDTVVEVRKDEIKTYNINEIDEYVWDSQLIKRDFDLKSFDEIEEKSDYYKFLKNISSVKSNKDDKWINDYTRLLHLLTIQGYLLHKYKSKSNARAVIFMDASLVGEPNGRTGKGLLVEGLNHIRKTIKEDGKSFKDDNRFKFSQVKHDTEILFLNDVKENFNFENFFPTITDGIMVEPKFENKFCIPFELSPKMVISTNYAITGTGASYFARMYEFELSNFYSETHTPVDDFNRLFFDEWDKEHWYLFDSLMVYSVKEYLNEGVVESLSICKDANKIITETNQEFYDWINNYEIESGREYNKKELYNSFCGTTGNIIRLSFPQILFTKYLKIWSRYNNLTCEETHSGNINKIIFHAV